MIALNEVISNKKLIEEKFKLMGKHFNLDKIIGLEQKYIVIYNRANELRAMCNKLCSEVADKINKKEETDELVAQINKLDNQISKLEKKCTRFMRNINKSLIKLPNPALSSNTLNLSLPTHTNPNFTAKDFVSELSKISDIKCTKLKFKQYIESLQNMVFKAEVLPKIIKFNSKKTEFLLLGTNNSIDILNQLIEILNHNSKYLIEKSIKYLRKESSKEFLAILNNKSRIEISFTFEYISRDFGIKYYDKQLDMTKFVNIIKIKIM